MKHVYDKLPKRIREGFARIKLLVIDFDGTLTDNSVHVDQDGNESVHVSRADGLGLEYLRRYGGVEAMILSKEKNPVVAARAGKLKLPFRQGVDDKLAAFKEEIAKRKLKHGQVCYIGNDLNDIECIKEAGIGVAVADSYPQVISIADYVTEHKGGLGAVREVCELILYSKSKHPYP